MSHLSALERQYRPRAGGYHVKTGCATCKIRHVKCDEEKPACLKCRVTGRVCDGYSTSNRACSSPAMLSKRDKPSSTELISIPPTLSGGFAGTDRERRGFEYFRWETKQEIGHALNLDIVYGLILQSSYSNAAVRSAVVALGSIAEKLQVNNVLSFDTEQAKSGDDFAQAKYRQALKQVREQIAIDPSRSENLAIISCFLFTLFEFLQGNVTASMVHLRSGLKMLRQQIGPPDLLRQELLRIFSIMDLQVTLLMGLKTFQAPNLSQIVHESPKVEGEIFANIEDAAISLTFLISKTYDFRRLVANDIRMQSSPSTVARKRDLGMQLEWWPLALESFLEDLGTGLNVEMLHRTIVMRMNHIITRVAFGACLHKDEDRVFLAHLGDFRHIVSLAKTVIRPMDALVRARVQRIVAANNAGINPVAVFSFYAGVIQPLYMTAIQCTDVKVCREAIDLLSTPPWHEGAWDSARMANMAKRKVRQLEKKAIMAMALI